MNPFILIGTGIILYYLSKNQLGNNRNSGGRVAPDLGTRPIFDIVNQLQQNPEKVYPTRPMSQISSIIIHHSGTTSGSASSYARTHVERRDWAGISYHYVIDKDGTINQTQYIGTRTNHAPNCNNSGIAICLTGDYEIQQVPKAQLDSCLFLCHEIQRNLGRRLEVSSHKQCTSNRTCPGRNMPMDYIRRNSNPF
ncbi:MAG: peptidoglycan recognition family protein [Bacteroidota bacterium]